MNSGQTIRVGLAGNPNSGKTTIFNAITGSHQKVGNYAGVTVEKKEGRRKYRDYEFLVYDLPGTYSLTAYSIDEVIARDFIIDEKPDVVIDVLDATNIERNLYLCLQFQELGIPVLGALNIMDQAESMGIRIDAEELSAILGIPLLRTVGTKGEGIERLLDGAIACVERRESPSRTISYGGELEAEIQKLAAVLSNDAEFGGRYPARWLAIKLIEKDRNAYALISRHQNAEGVRRVAGECVQRIEKHFGSDAEIVVSEQRYGYIRGAVAETVTREDRKHVPTELIDQVLLNRAAGFPIFLAIFWVIFQLTFKLGKYPMTWLESLFGWLSGTAASLMSEGPWRSLLVDGIIGGVGGVFSFVPLVVILFLCISFLEDTGYMARAAFIMDKFLHLFGLHGQSFLPMTLGFGCSVPAVMAARTLKSPRDRIITVMVTPFMSCGAKLPIHVLLAGAFFPAHPGNAVLAIYVIGIALALFSSLILRHIVLPGEPTPFVMELPPYRMPTLSGMLWHVRDKTWQYFQRAGTVILAASILIWGITSFPKPPASAAATAEQALAYSCAGRLGRSIEPVIRPLGFDWKIGIATITGFAAKEVVVSTLGVLYKVGAAQGAKSEPLRQALRNDKTFNPLVAFGLMLFMLLIPPCLAAQAAIRAEIGWQWLGFFVLYSLSVAWCVCFAVHQLGTYWLGLA
jgi:ferrous iron transport protein B